MISEPIDRLFKREVDFVWGNNQQEAIDTLKLKLTQAPILRAIDYGEDAGDIILAVDASLKGWGAVLM